MANCRNKNLSRQGIALVVVLGFLTILVILGIAFAISMRVERIAAASYVENVRARHLVQAALARALQGIDASVTNEAYPSWPDECLASGGGGASCNSLLMGYASNFLPQALVAGASAAAASVNWNTLSVLTGNYTSRYAYLAVNCSGLLDANYVGGSNRVYGTDPGEISVSPQVLSEMNGGAFIDNINNALVRNRTTKTSAGFSPWQRLDSVPEFDDLGHKGNDPDQVLENAVVGNRRYPADFLTYSYLPFGQFATGSTPMGVDAVYIGGPEASVIATQNTIVAHFQAMGMDAVSAQMAARNVIDYIDSNYEPGNGAGLLDFCTEPVPMINEITISNRITAVAQPVPGVNDVYENTLDFTVELFYPFVAHTNPNAYTVEVVFWTPAAMPASFWWPGPPATIMRAVAAGPWDGSVRHQIVKLTPPATRTFSVPNGLAPGIVVPPVLLTEFRVRQGNMDPNGVLVDLVQQFPTPWAAQLAAVPMVPGTNEVLRGRECNDPRINWQWTNPIQWQVSTDPAGHTLGNPNTRTTYTTTADPDADGSWYMYVRNRDNLATVGELGFLLYTPTNPWHTIRLLGTNALPVLDHFVARSERTRKGLVNPNSLQTNVLAATLFGCAAERWPGEGSVVLNDARSRSIAVQITTNMYTNLSHIAKLDDGGLENALPGTLDRYQKEAIIRNTAGLWCTRQQLYMIFVAAQVLDLFGNPSAEQRAIALVWRDPYADASGRHPVFVRQFRWLPE